MKIRTVSLWACALLSCLPQILFGLHLPAHCKYDEECLLEVPGMLCADETPSYITLTARKHATNALIYLSGGGACWNKSTCSLGFASQLTRVEPNNDWNNGTGIFNQKDLTNPFRENYHIITVPYCTGDVFVGNKKMNYGTKKSPHEIHHHGFQNVVLALHKAKEILQKPHEIILLGQSAGGIGAYFHARTLNETFPDTRKFIISDSGTPFKPPYLTKTSYRYLMKSWGVTTTLPKALPGITAPTNFCEVIDYNKQAFPHIKFAMVGAYGDYVMTFFALSLGAPKFYSIVRDVLVDVAENYIGESTPNAKVYYINAYHHTFLGKPLAQIFSLNQRMDQWLEAMLTDDPSWENIRPDWHYRVNTNADWLGNQQPQNIDELLNFRQ